MVKEFVVRITISQHVAVRTPRYYGQQLKSREIRIPENSSRYNGLSPLRTPNLGPYGVRYIESTV